MGREAIQNQPERFEAVAAHHPIYLFRHGETVWNAQKRAQGHLDSPLTEAGRAPQDAFFRLHRRAIERIG